MKFVVTKDVFDTPERVAKRMEEHLRTFFHDPEVTVTVMVEDEEPPVDA